MAHGRLPIRVLWAVILIGGLVSVRQVAAEDKLWVERDPENPPIELHLPSFAPVIEKLGEAVVNISVEGEDSSQSRSVKGLDQALPDLPSPFGQFGQGDPQGKRPFSSLGSGFVIHPAGYIVTNNHLVERAKKIVVVFRGDKKRYTANVVGLDPKTDIALIKVDVGRKLAAAVLGDSDSLLPGDWVIAIGNPFRFGHTATVGIVSAKSRRVPGGGPYGDFIQTDASINPGNSGGPLFNARGEVVGISSAIFSPGRFGLSTGFNIGIGFATPINLAKGVLLQLREKGHVVRGWLGVLIQPVSADMAEAMRLDSAEGALVADVMEKSPAIEAGFKRGDVIISYDGHRVEENDDLPLMVAETALGKTVEVEIIRGGERRTIAVKISELKEEEAQGEVGQAEESEIGAFAQEMTAELARGLGLNEVKGVVISGVTPGSPAEQAGFQRGDVVLEMAGKAVDTLADFRSASVGLRGKKPVLVLLYRSGMTLFVTLRVE